MAIFCAVSSIAAAQTTLIDPASLLKPGANSTFLVTKSDCTVDYVNAATLLTSGTGISISGNTVSVNNIPETSITDGSLLARVGGNETITGNWTFNSSLTLFQDAGTYLFDNVDATKLARFQASGITTGTVRNYTLPNADGTLALTSNSAGLVDLTSGVTGTLPVASGGTGATTFTNNRLLTGNGTSAVVDEANLTFDGTTLSALSNANSQTDNIVIYNSNAGSGASSVLRFWNNSSTAANRGLAIQLPSSAYSSPYAGSATYLLYETGSQISASGNSARMLLNSTGLYLGSATAPSERLHVNGNAYVTGNISAAVQPALERLHISGNGYITGNLGAGVQPATARLHAVGTNNTTILAESNNTIGTTFEVKNTSSGGGNYTFACTGSANSYGAGAFIGYDNLIGATRYWINPSGYFGITAATTLSARLHVTGTGATSATDAVLIENSAGTDILRVQNNVTVSVATAPVATQTLTVRGATSDATEKVFVAERASGTDVLGVQNDGKVSINNAAYTEAVTVNGKVQANQIVLNTSTASNVLTGNIIYTDDATHGGYLTLGDGDRQLAMMPTMIERQVIDWAVDWTTGRKGAFWTVPARFNGWRISKVYIECTAVGSGAGDDVLEIEINSVTEGTQTVTALTHTLVMDDAIATNDIVTINPTAISATPAKGLNVSFELKKN